MVEIVIGLKKTGTSNGLRDAWCFAFNRDYTIGVWLGNKSGRAAETLVGVEAAAPVAAAIATALFRDHQPTPIRVETAGTIPVTLCAQTGLRSSAACPLTIPGIGVAGVPLHLCPGHTATGTPEPGACRATADALPPAAPVQPVAEQSTTPQLLQPQPGVYVAPEAVLRLQVAAAGNRACQWLIDGASAGEHRAEFWHLFAKGSHRIRCVNAAGASDMVVITVR